MNSEIEYKRRLKVDLPPRQSAFFWGARKTGKSTYLAKHFSQSVYYDLLDTDLYLKYSKRPALFREEVLALSDLELQYPIIVDEVQKIPSLLDEIHWLIEHTNAQFILCGSSARKLKRSSANLLGGRAWRYSFYPLVYPEVPDFNLLTALNTGLIPSHYLSTNPQKSLRAYVQDYLMQEIQIEGLTRNLPVFARFLDTLAFSNGELVNFANIARDCAIDAKTVKSYYEILVDTLLGYFVEPYAKKKKRDLIAATPKFYLFDVGLAGVLTQRTILELKGSEAGRAFEHFILMELIAYRGINDLDFTIAFWRTKTGLEVDFVLSHDIAIEVKIGAAIDQTELRGLKAFCEEHCPDKAYVVSLDQAKRNIKFGKTEILILPYAEFLPMLWNGEIFK